MSSTNSCGTGLRCFTSQRVSSSGREAVLRRAFDMEYESANLSVSNKTSARPGNLQNHDSPILSLMLTAGKNREVLSSKVRDIRPRFVQLDEMWGFVHTRDRT